MILIQHNIVYILQFTFTKEHIAFVTSAFSLSMFNILFISNCSFSNCSFISLIKFSSFAFIHLKSPSQALRGKWGPLRMSNPKRPHRYFTQTLSSNTKGIPFSTAPMCHLANTACVLKSELWFSGGEKLKTETGSVVIEIILPMYTWGNGDVPRKRVCFGIFFPN